MANIDGLQNVRNITGGIKINNCDGLTSLHGLRNAHGHLRDELHITVLFDDNAHYFLLAHFVLMM
jgi:hypothetical protein